MTEVLTLTGVELTYPTGVTALTGVSLALAAGEFVSVVGPSGCGKSTLLRLAAGLAEPTAGELTRNATEVGYVFQDPTLLPWRTVRRNVQLPAELRGLPRQERIDRATEALARVGLSDVAHQRPRTLSGGMRMRVSLARTLTMRPDLFLFDEPFAAVDELTRARLGDDLRTLFTADRAGPTAVRDGSTAHRAESAADPSGAAALFVTHSVAEAVYLSDRVLVMSSRPGRILTEVPVTLPADRRPALRFSPEFAALTGLVHAALEADGAVDHPAASQSTVEAKV